MLHEFSLIVITLIWKQTDTNQCLTDTLKSVSHLPRKFICFNESPLKMMKNDFYFIVEAFFALEIFKFLC